MLFKLQINKNKQIKLINYLFYVFCFFLFLSLVYSNFNQFFFQHGDSAFFVDLMYNVGKHNTIFSSIYSSHADMGKYLTSPPEIYCKFNNDNLSLESNIFKIGHLYLIVFLFSLFVKLGANPILLTSIIFSLNFILIFYLVYSYLNKKGLNKTYVLLFLLLLFFYLPFSMSWVGQFYFDRLFILPMIYLIFLIENFSLNRKNKIIFFILLFYIASLHERAAFMAGCYLIAHVIFFYKQDIKFKFLFIISGIILIFYFIVYVKFFQQSYYKEVYTISSLLGNINLLIDNSYNVRDLTIKLLLLNSPFILLSSLNLRYLLISLGTILPNILFYIGGAEKIGLTTHYHSFYIPFLISGAVFGILKLKNFKKNKILNNSFITFVIFCTIFNLSYDFSSRDKILDFKSTYGNHGKALYLMKTFPYLHKNFWKWKNEKNIMPVKRLLNKIPSNRSVSVHENLQVFFATRKNEISFFPLGLGKSDYVVVEKQNDDDDRSVVFASFLSADNKEEILKCIDKKINSHYMLLDKRVLWHGGSISLYKKN